MKASINFTGTGVVNAVVQFCNDDWTPCKEKESSARVSGSLGKYGYGGADVRKSMARMHESQNGKWAIHAEDADYLLALNEVDVLHPTTMENINTGNIPVRFENEKAVVWYEFEASGRTYRTRNLSKGKRFIETWLGYDCPDLMRFETNSKDVSYTMMGCTYCVFSGIIVSGSDFDEELTVEEAAALAKGCRGDETYIGQKLNKWIAAKSVSPEEIAKAVQRVSDAERKIQEVAKAHKDELFAAEHAIPEDPNAFDCGWLNWYAEGQLGEDISMLKAAGKRSSKSLDVGCFPYDVQSVYRQADAGKLFVEEVLKETPYQIRFETHLD